MAINALGQDRSIYGDSKTTSDIVADKTKLNNDDFMTLLLVELQNQDPTEPTDTEQILSQTSELATLESTDKTNKALENLSKTMAASSGLSAIAAIGKTADLGSDSISVTEGGNANFEIYFPKDIASGNITITDADGKIVKTVSATQGDAGVYSYSWDGKDNEGNSVDEGIYHVLASYTDATGENLQTKVGRYPIESVRFDNGEALVKLGSNYMPLNSIKEIY